MASPRKSDSSDDSSPPSREDQPPEDPPIQPARPDPPFQRSRPPRPSSPARPCGFDYEFVECPPPQVQYECPVCLQVLRDPQQTTCCGISFCKGCIDRVVKDGKPCPTCNKAFSIFPNKGLKRTLGGFRVYCSNKDKGCEWVGELGDIERHLNSKPSSKRQLKGCLFEEVACIYCTCLFQRRYINPHQSNDECPKRPYICKHCGHDATYEEVMHGHYQALVEVQSREPEQHVDLSGCPLEIVTCNFHGVGCQVELPRRDVPAHLGRKIVNHSAFLLSTAQRTTSNVDTVQSGQNEMQASLARLQEMVDAQDGRIKELQDENRRLQASLQEAVTAQEDENRRLQASLQETVTAQEDENRRLQERQRSTNARLQKITHGQSQALFWGLALVLALAAIGIGIAVGNVRDGQMASAESKPESFPVDSGIQINEGENVAVTLAQTLELVKQEVAIEKSAREEMAKFLAQVENEVATEKSEREDVTDTLAQNLSEVEKEVATEKRERKKTADSLVRVEREVATEKRERKNVTDTLAQNLTEVEKEVTTGKREREMISGSLNELDDKISMRGTVDSTTSSTSEIEMKQSAVMRHLQMIPHEMVLPFEFTIDKYQEYKTEDRMWESPPFYTHSHGYTLCIDVRASRIDPNISVYAYLMLGAFDDDLKWPFQGNVTIELVNQAESSRFNPIVYVSSRKKSHIGSFDFAETLDSRVNRRVTVSKRAKLGNVIHHFIAHSALDYDAVEGTQYLKDDSLKFRISKVTNIL